MSGYRRRILDGQSAAFKAAVLIHLKGDRPSGCRLTIWWILPEGELITTCTIITTEPNEVMKTLHDRMPVILPKEFEARGLILTTRITLRWLECSALTQQSEIKMHTVSPLVNSTANDSPDCMERRNQLDSLRCGDGGSGQWLAG